MRTAYEEAGQAIFGARYVLEQDLAEFAKRVQRKPALGNLKRSIRFFDDAVTYDGWLAASLKTVADKLEWHMQIFEDI